LESIIAKYLGTVMEKHLNPRQHGNRKNYSTLTQLFCVHEELLEETLIHGRVDCIRVDFTRAADLVVHSLLIEKLRYLGIDPSIVRWIRAFLTDRLQLTKVNNVVSEPLKVTSGLPQGSPLCNVLLNIYLNDLHTLTNRRGEIIDYNIYQYSDDSLIYKKITCEQDCFELQSALDAFGEWTEKHGMQINSTKKCHFMSFTIPGQEYFDFKFEYELLGKEIIQTKNMKYLGNILSDDFSFFDQFKFVKDISTNEKIEFLLEIYQLLHLYPDIQSTFYTQDLRPKLENLSWNLPLTAIYQKEHLAMECFLFQNNTVSNKNRSRLSGLGKRRLMKSLCMISKVINRDAPYMHFSKRVDVFAEGFQIDVFRKIMHNPHSILGNGLKILTQLEKFLQNNENNNGEKPHVTVASVMSKFSWKNSYLNEFCADTFNKLISPKPESEEYDHRAALRVINECLHPNSAIDELEEQIKVEENTSENNN